MPAIPRWSAPSGSCRRAPITLLQSVEEVARSSRAIAAACLCDADHALGRRYGRDRRGAQGALSAHRRPAQGGHLLRHHQPPGGGEAGRAAWSSHDRGRLAEFLQLAAAQGGGRARRLPARGAGAARREIDWTLFGSIASLGITAGASAPEVWSRRSSAPFAERYRVSVETVTAADEDIFFPLPRALRENEAAE
jgi:hypothetical protein